MLIFEEVTIQIVESNVFKTKLDIFKYLNRKQETTGNTLFNELVIKNNFETLSLILELVSQFGFNNLLGFNLKNLENKTALEIALLMKDYDAMYLLNHFKSFKVSNKSYKLKDNDLIILKIS